MAIQHEAAEVVLRVMAQVDNALKGFKQVTKQAKKTQQEITDFGSSFSKQRIAAMEAETSAHEKMQQKMVRDAKKATDQLRRDAQKRNKAFMDRAVGTPRVADLGRTLAALKASRKASGAAFRGGMFADPGNVKGPTARLWRAQQKELQKVHPMAAKINKGFAVHSMAAAMGQSPFVQPKGKYGPSISRADREKFVQPKGKYGPFPERFIQPKGTYGPVISAADRKAHQFAVDQARGFYGSYGPSRADMYGPAVQPRGAYGPHFSAAQRAAANASIPYYGPHLPTGGGPISGGQFGPFDSPTLRASRRRAQAARHVADQGLPPEIAARLAQARQIGGPLSVMPGVLGKIVAGFKAAAVSKDAFAANVFAKMPPCFMLFKNVASAVYRIGAWGFTRAWQGANLFARTLSIFPSLVMKLGSSVSNGFNRISNAIRNSLGNLQAFGTKLRTAGIYTTAAITAPLVSLGVGTVSEGASFDKAMTESVARAGLNSGGTRKIDDRLRKQMETAAIDLSLSGLTAYNPTQLAQGYTELAAAGLEATHLIRALPIVASLAQAGEMDLTKTTNALTTAMGALGVTTESIKDPIEYAKQMKAYSDVMVTVANMTQASVESVSQSMTSDAGPAAKAYGMSIKELGALIGIYAEKGIKGAKAGNMAGRALRLVTSSFTRNKGVWQRAGIEIADATGKWLPFNQVLENLNSKLATLSNVERTELLKKLGLRDLSQKSIEPLLGTADAFKRLMDEMQGGGQTSTMAAIQMEAFSNQIQVMWNHISAIKIDLFKILAPYLLVIAKAVNEVAKSFIALLPETKKSIVLILAALATIGPILLGLGTMIAVVVAGFSTLGFILAPIALLLSPIGLVIAAATALAIMWASTFKFDVAGMWNRASAALNRFANFAMGFMQNFGPNMMIVWNWLETQLSRFSQWSTETLNNLGMLIGEVVKKHLPALADIWAGLQGGNFFAKASNFFNQAVGFVTNLPDNLVVIFNWLQQHWDLVAEYLSKRIWQGISISVEFFVRSMNIVGTALLNALKFTAVEFISLMMDGFQALGAFMGNTIAHYGMKALKTILMTMPGGVILAKTIPDIGIRREPLDDFLNRVQGDLKKAEETNPANAILSIGKELWDKFQAEKPKMVFPGMPGLNLNVPNFQAPNLKLGEPNKPLFFEDAGENRNVAANNTKLFEQMVLALQSINQNDTKKPKIVLSPAGIA